MGYLLPPKGNLRVVARIYYLDFGLALKFKPIHTDMYATKKV